MIVAIQFVPAGAVSFVANIFVAQGGYGAKGVVQHVGIQVAVQVVVEEHGVGAKAFIVQAVGGGLFGEGTVALVDKQFILPATSFYIAGVAYVDIELPIAVHVGHAYAGRPYFAASYSRCFGGVPEREVTLVEKQAVGLHIGGEVHVG